MLLDGASRGRYLRWRRSRGRSGSDAIFLLHRCLLGSSRRKRSTRAGGSGRRRRGGSSTRSRHSRRCLGCRRDSWRGWHGRGGVRGRRHGRFHHRDSIRALHATKERRALPFSLGSRRRDVRPGVGSSHHRIEKSTYGCSIETGCVLLALCCIGRRSRMRFLGQQGTEAQGSEYDGATKDHWSKGQKSASMTIEGRGLDFFCVYIDIDIACVCV